MRKIHIFAEGQTEEQFIKKVLWPYVLCKSGNDLNPVIAKTKRMGSDPSHKGGTISYTKFRDQVNKLLGDTSADEVSMMFDYYALPQDFPGCVSPQGNSCYARVEYIETEIAKDINNKKFRPFLMLHEYEAILFTKPDCIVDRFHESGSKGYTAALEELIGVRDAYHSPEEINKNPKTHPSARLRSLFRMYNKVLHGFQIADDIGIAMINRACPHFKTWVRSLCA